MSKHKKKSTKPTKSFTVPVAKKVETVDNKYALPIAEIKSDLLKVILYAVFAVGVILLIKLKS